MRRAFGALSLVLAGCTPVQVRPYQPLNFAATDTVEVLQQIPERDHDVIAELRDASSNEVVLRLVGKAKEIGADAIILVGEEVVGGVAIPTEYGVIARTGSQVIALAIRWRR